MKEQKIIPISFGMVKAFLIKRDKYVLIDTGLPGKLKAIKEELKKNHVDPKDISLIVCTHNHTDHVGEVHNLKELTKAKVAIHKSEADTLREGKSTETKPTGLFGKVISKFFKNPSFKPVTADILIEDELDMNGFGVDGKIIHTPGHTPGSLTIVLADGEIIVGDMLSGKKSGEEYKADLPIFATDMGRLKESLKQIVKLSPRIIHNSHGVPIDVKAVEVLIGKLERKNY
jgi:glyoxylase-like metal-dependent hydrolase (beta-lactamase superfamily II)